MDFKRLEQDVMRDEGFSARPYKDTVGVVTIGYGSTKLYGKPIPEDATAIDIKTARTQLRADLYEALIYTTGLYPTFWLMVPERREVLVNMCYNLGPSRLATFTKLKRCADLLDYEGMAREMEQSRWYGQVGNRSKRLVEIMRKGSM